MIINIKLIEHERFEDAPFVGALICANDCNINCPGCFNQHLKQLATIQKNSNDIINEILLNKFNKGIILSGLEWSLQKEEMLELINLAQKNNLKVMIYTGLSEDIFKDRCKEVYEIKNIYIKFGNYNRISSSYVSENVKLASKNQYIKKL